MNGDRAMNSNINLMIFKIFNPSKWSILKLHNQINPFLTVDNLKASISEKTNMPAEKFKIK